VVEEVVVGEEVEEGFHQVAEGEVEEHPEGVVDEEAVEEEGEVEEEWVEERK